MIFIAIMKNIRKIRSTGSAYILFSDTVNKTFNFERGMVYT